MSARSWYIVGACIALSACTAIRDQSLQLGRDMQYESQRSTAKLIDYMTVKPPPDTALKPMPPSYCYQVMMDIVCYDQPQPGAQGRLVGAQGTQNSVVTTAGSSVWHEPSPAAGTVSREVMVQEVELEALKPVYVAPAKDVSGTPD